MLREPLERILGEYVAARSGGDNAFKGHPLASFIRGEARDNILAAAKSVSLTPALLSAKGSAGDLNRWTHTPWIAVMDRRETDSVRENVYVVYLFATDCSEVYLTINQGCTRLYQSAIRNKEETARVELQRRAMALRQRLPPLERLRLEAIDLKQTGWRSRLYEAGTVVGVRYLASELPNERTLVADLAEAIRAYGVLIDQGGWSPDDQILLEAEEEVGRSLTIQEAKCYRQHRRIERSPSTSKKVKDLLGARCMACDLRLGEVYGPIAEGYIEAHHLRPLSSYHDGVQVTLDPRRDFAALRELPSRNPPNGGCVRRPRLTNAVESRDLVELGAPPVIFGEYFRCTTRPGWRICGASGRTPLTKRRPDLPERPPPVHIAP